MRAAVSAVLANLDANVLAIAALSGKPSAQSSPPEEQDELKA